MKKVMFVVLCLMLVSTMAFALESGPSNKVGYIKVTCTGTSPTAYSYTSFGLPFKFWYVPTGNVPTYGTESRAPSSIVGTQSPCGSVATADKIIQQNNGHSAYRNTACVWSGTLETGSEMWPGAGYYYANRTGASRTLVLAGEADTSGTGIPAVSVLAPTGSTGKYTYYSWRDPRVLARNTLGLWTQGFTGGSVVSSDKVMEQLSGAFFYCSTANPPVWASNSTPPLTGVTPGMAYYIINKHIAHPWTYTFNGSGLNLIQTPPPSSGLEAPTTVPTELLKVTPTVRTKTSTRVSHGAAN